MTIAHVRCGSDIRDGLAAAQIGGDFIEYSDPVCQGPVPDDRDEADLMDLRAAFLSAAYDAGTVDACRARLAAERAAIDGLDSYAAVFLWFEHDIYDQSVLIRLFDIVADRPDLAARLLLIAVDRFPGIDRFTGLGQLTPGQLATLPERAEPVTAAQTDLGRRAWAAFRAADPMGLWDLCERGTPDLPLLAGALRRHLMDLPWSADGLSLTERLALRAVAEGAETPGKIFARLCRELEPQHFLGDAMFWPILRTLADSTTPALAPFDSWESPVSLTGFGRDLLAGKADWCAANGIDRWLGGVHLQGTAPPWRWNGETEMPEAA